MNGSTATVPRMTSRERVLAALRREPVDRTPVANPTSVATVELMDLVDAYFPEANRDPELMARLAATGHTELGFDSIMPVFSIIQESSALGCKMQWEQKDNWPTVRMREPIWEQPEDINIPDGFLDHQDTRCVLDAIKILRREFGDEVAIIGKTMGPWTLGYHCFGVEPFLLMSYDDEAKTKDALDRMKEISVLFGVAQIEAGADALTFPDHATGDLVSGDYYYRYLKDLHIEMVERIPVPLILHICGRTVDRMGFIADTGMAAFHYDSKNKPQESMEAVHGGIALVGNVNNPETLFSRDRPKCGSRSWPTSKPVCRWSPRSAQSPSRPPSRTCSRSPRPCGTGTPSVPRRLEGRRRRHGGTVRHRQRDHPVRDRGLPGTAGGDEPQHRALQPGPPSHAGHRRSLIEGEHHDVDRLTQHALDEGIEALEVMDDGLIAGMGIVGIKFRENFIFVPEVLACARAMKAGMRYIEPILSASGVKPVGTVIMGTVKGDLHDIGKNLCIMMLRGSGFVVVDLGVDTSPDEFIDAVEEHEAKVLGMSALLTTTMPNMGRTIEAFIDEDLRDEVQIMVGGAPVTQEFADDMGADGYGKDALACVALAKQLVADAQA